MRFFNRRSNKPRIGQAVPDPVQVDLSEHRQDSGVFINYPDRSGLSPAPSSWKIPSVEEQTLWVATLIDRHVESGSLDEGVPDLIDILIHRKMAEIRKEIDAAYYQAHQVEHELFEHAMSKRVEVSAKLKRLREQLAEEETGYRRAYKALTWEEPNRSLEPLAVKPTLISTEVAEELPSEDLEETTSIAETRTNPFSDQLPDDETPDENVAWMI